MTTRRTATALAATCTIALAGCGSSAEGSTGSGTAVSSATSSAGRSAVCPPAGGTSTRVTSFAAAPPMCIDPARMYTAKVSTDVGDLTIALDAKKAPKTVNNFVFLARNHFYDGIVFHRVIPGFMNQTGDPQGTGQGGPGYEFADELPAAGEYRLGSVAMANAGPNTNGSQFFTITGENGVALPPAYSLFGQVTEGMDVLHAIEKDGSADGTPARQHRMKTVSITES